MKDKIINILKVFLLVFPALVGLTTLYAIALYLIGLPAVWWTTAIAAVIAGVSEIAIIYWIGTTDNEQ